jgi:hypothetical protein
LWPFEKALQAFSVHELQQIVIKIEAAIAEKTTRSVQVDASLFHLRIMRES